MKDLKTHLLIRPAITVCERTIPHTLEDMLRGTGPASNVSTTIKTRSHAHAATATRC